MYEIPCPECQAGVTVSAAKAGGQVNCPECRTVIEVPKLGQLRAMGGAQDVAASEPPPSGELPGGRSFLLAAFGLVAVICMLAAAFCGVNWLTSDATFTTQQHLTELEKAYDEINSAQFIREYEDITEYGVDVPAPYPYHKDVLAKQAWANKTIALAGLGLLAAVLAVLSGRRSRATA